MNIKKVLIFASLLLSLILIYFIFRNLSAESPSASELLESQDTLIESSEVGLPATLPEEENTFLNQNEFEEKLAEFLKEVGELQQDPEQAEMNLEFFAESLKKDELNVLKDRALDPGNDGDARALAIYILNLNGSQESMKLLSDIILSELESFSDPRLTEQEHLLRSMAVEGLAHPHEKNFAINLINNLSSKTKDSQILDRLQRTKAYLEGKAPKPVYQDLEALEKIISFPDASN